VTIGIALRGLGGSVEIGAHFEKCGAGGGTDAVMNYVTYARTIADDARFRSAAGQICTMMLACHEANPAFARLISDRAQAHIVGLCYHLDPHANAAAVLRLLPPDTASRNRVTAHLHALEGRGALVPSASNPDRRANNRMLAPAFRAWVDSWVEAVVLPALPFVAEPTADLHDSATRQRWFSRWAVAQALGLRLSAHVPRIRHFLDLRGGYVVLNELLRRDYAPAGSITTRFSRREMAMRYGLTRTHLIDLVAALHAEGWVIDGPLGPQPTDAMREAARLWHGLHLAAASMVLSGTLMPTIEEAVAARRAG
jgi:hypothetical protein